MICQFSPLMSWMTADAAGQQRRHHRAHTLARARGRKGQDVFRPFVPQVVAVMLAEKDAGGLRQPGLANVGDIGPAGRAIGRHFARGASATDMAMATTTASRPLLAAIMPPVSNTCGA